MTTKPVVPAARPARHPRQFPELPPRDDMNNPLYLHDPGHQPALRLHLGAPATTIVLSEVPVAGITGSNRACSSRICWWPSTLTGPPSWPRRVIPSTSGAEPPDFVLEVASDNNAENDYVAKRMGYAAFRVPEYWRFDHTGGTLYPAALAGDGWSTTPTRK